MDDQDCIRFGNPSYRESAAESVYTVRDWVEQKGLSVEGIM